MTTGSSIVDSFVAALAVTALLAIAAIFLPHIEFKIRKIFKRPLIIFISYGGTCRDPMAKIIAEHTASKQGVKVSFKSRGVVQGATKGASLAARQIIKEKYGFDHLKAHRSKTLSQGDVDAASLLLTMETKHSEPIQKGFKRTEGKLNTLNDFFGLSGEIENPFREHGQLNAETLSRYRHCFAMLETALTSNFEKLRAATDL